MVEPEAHPVENRVVAVVESLKSRLMFPMCSDGSLVLVACSARDPIGKEIKASK